MIKVIQSFQTNFIQNTPFHNQKNFSSFQNWMSIFNQNFICICPNVFNQYDESHEVIKSEAQIEQHEVVQIFHTVRSFANIENIHIDVNFETIENCVNLQEKKIIPCIETIENSVNLQENKIIPCTDTIEISV